MHRLPHTFDALISRFGRFTEIQEKAIDPLLAGRNCILISATASGKTEAALAPILERLLQKRHSTQHSALSTKNSTISTLFIVPTRALTRDLARRLVQPLSKLALTLAIKTGDEPALKQNRSSDILLTTPESFDSLLANRPRMLKSVSAVILDELHLYEDSARGDQLIVLLNRLRRLRRFAHEKGDAKDASVQFCALSATIDNPLQMASRYFTEPIVIESKGQRLIDAELIEFEGTDSLRNLFARLSNLGFKKVLVFCQSRAECERLTQQFRQTMPFGDRVYVHHASLAARVRHEAEEKFSTLDAALCFATSTLELGIDIGDVDLIVLIGPPDNVASFLQRVGRGNRRTRKTNVVCLYSGQREHALFRIFLRQARLGQNLQSNLAAPFRPSVVAQQLFSYIKQTRNGEIEPNMAYELFTTPEGQPLLSKYHYDQIIERLLSEDYFAISPHNRLLKPGTRWQELYEQRAIYTNLSNDNTSIEVVDELTGRRIGFIERAVPEGSTFLFGGHARRATRRFKRKLFVNPANDMTKPRPYSNNTSRHLTPELVRALALELGISLKEKRLPILIEETRDETEDETSTHTKAVLLHCSGYAYGLVLGDLLEKNCDCAVEEYDELSLTLNLNGPVEQINFSEAEIKASVQKRWRQFENWFSPGAWQKTLPPSVRAAYVVESFQIEKFYQMFAENSLQIVE